MDGKTWKTAVPVEPEHVIRAWRRLPWHPMLNLAGTIALTIGLVLLPFDASRFGAYGYGILCLRTLLSSATVVLPSPALAAARQASRTLDPVLVGLVSGLAADRKSVV